MNPTNKAVIPVAAPRINKFNLPSQHLTTANFMQFNCAYARQICPNSRGKLNHKTFMRAEPMDKPCLGSAQVHNRAFFVPFRTVWEPFSDFINDVPHNQPEGTGLISNVPRIPNSVLVAVFQDSQFASVTTAVAFDFAIGSSNYNLTPAGRQAMKLIESLGYKVVFNSKDDFYFSALPLLSLAKVYIDYYYPSAYAHYGIYATIDGIMQRHITYDLTSSEIITILNSLCYVAYTDDFFVDSWDNPVGPNSNVGSVDFNILDPTYQGSGSYNLSVYQSSSNGTPFIVQGLYAQTVTATQYSIDSLKALTDYVQRHRLAGARALDRALAQWGVTLSADKLRRCYYLGDDSFPFEIGDVMSTSDTSPSGGASLGSYAGKGVGFSGDKGLTVDFDTEEFGYLFVISSIVPDVSYPFGIDRNTLCKFKLDFLNPEFDALGPAAVSKSEVAVDMHNTNDWNSVIVPSIFSFGSRYYEWKIPYDRFTGSFRYGSINTDLNGWSTVREFNYSGYGNDAENFVHNLNFVRGIDYLQYDRIFLGYSDDDAVDPFFVIHRDNLELYSPMKSLYDSYDFDAEKAAKSVTMSPNGTKVN